MTRNTPTQTPVVETKSPITEDELAAIRERYRIATEDTRYWDDSNQEREADRSSMHDVPDLLAEAKRLQEENREQRRIIRDYDRLINGGPE